MTAGLGTTTSDASFENSVAFITGGARGFGLAFATALAQRGASVALADLDVKAAGLAADELVSAGHRAMAVQCNVADEDSVAAAVAQVTERFGGIDHLINNAGLHLTRYNRPFVEQPLDDLRALFDVNVIGVVLCTLACRPVMAERGGGTVLNISSMASHSSSSPYGVSKLAVRGLTLAFAQELSAHGIRVNAISPGLQATESAMADMPEASVRHIVDEMQMIHRLGTETDIVEAMLYLCSDRAGFVTGVTLPVTGGAMLGI